MSKKKVFLNPGHGGSDPGAMGYGLQERCLNLEISLSCSKALQRSGVNVMLSRTTNTEEGKVNDVVKKCNGYDPDLAVSIHINAGGGEGFEIYHHHGGGTSKTLAKNINDTVVKMGRKSRGLKVKLNDQGKDYLGFIRQTKAPAVLAECGFIDNANDAAFLQTEAGKEAYGEAIAQGILKTLGVAYKTPEEEKPSPAEETSFPTEWEWAKAQGITDGSNPKGNITREQSVAMLHRFARKRGLL